MPIITVLVYLTHDKQKRELLRWATFPSGVQYDSGKVTWSSGFGGGKRFYTLSFEGEWTTLKTNILRSPMRRALEALAMEQQSEGKATLPAFAQQLIERGKLDGIREGKLDGIREGKLDGLREALLRLIARAGLALTENDRARIQACEDPAILDHWVENVLGAKTVADVLA